MKEHKIEHKMISLQGCKRGKSLVLPDSIDNMVVISDMNMISCEWEPMEYWHTEESDLLDMYIGLCDSIRDRYEDWDDIVDWRDCRIELILSGVKVYVYYLSSGCIHELVNGRISLPYAQVVDRSVGLLDVIGRLVKLLESRVVRKDSYVPSVRLLGDLVKLRLLMDK